MLLIKKPLLDSYLKAIYRNYSWLSDMTGFHKSYISQVVNNRCKISMPCVSAFLRVTGIPFEKLFHDDGKIDTREFYGDVYVVENKAMRLRRYKEYISQVGQYKESPNHA